MVLDPMSLGIISPNLGASAATTKLDTAAFVGADEAQASIGQGIAKAGSALDQIAIKKNTADTITAQYRAAEAMEQTQANIALAVANEPDQSKWDGIAAEHLGRLSTTLDGIPNVPPDAKAGIDHKLTMFTTDTYEGLGVHAAKKSEADAVDSIHAIVDRAGRTGDAPLGIGAIDGAVAHGLITPERGADMKVIFGQRVQATRENQMISTGEAAIQADPRAAYDHFKSESFDAPPTVKQRLIRAAHAALVQDKQAVSDDLLGKIDKGSIVVQSQIDEEQKNNPKITDDIASHASRVMDSINSKKKQQWNVDNSSLVISGVMSAIRAYDVRKDPDLKAYDAINSYISESAVPGDKDVLRRALKTASSPLGGGAVKETNPVMQVTVKTLDDMQKKQEFGIKYITPGKASYTFKDAAGKTRVANPQAPSIDRDAEARSQDVKIKIEAGLRDYLARKPDASQEDMINEMHTLIPRYAAARSVPTIWGIPLRGIVPDDQTKSTVPTRRDPADIIRGLPQYPGRIPKAEAVPDEEERPAEKEESLPEQTGTRDPGDGLPSVEAPSLFPQEGGNVVGGANMLLPLPEQDGGDLPPDRKKKKGR